MSDKHRSRLLANDKRAMVAAASNPWPDDSDILHSLSIPCLIVSGDREGQGFELAKRGAGEVKGATFVPLEGLSHMDILGRSDVVLPHIVDFLSCVEAG
jgi:pimeloyl-ACP methyl ester carboxylesterase